MSDDLVARAVTLHSLPLGENVVIAKPELAVLQFGTKTLDLGGLCYAVRIVPTAPAASDRRVNLQSLSLPRVARVGKLIRQISEKIRQSRLRMPTHYSTYARFVAYVNWTDVEGLVDTLGSEASARAALTAYFAHLRERVLLNTLSLKSATSQQNAVLEVLGEFHGVDFGRGLNLLITDRHVEQATVPPSEEAQGRVLSLCDSLFTGLSTFVLEAIPFPHMLPMPGFLGFPNNQLAIFPGRSWFKTPAMIATKVWHSGYDFAEGRLATPAELKLQYPSKGTPWSEVLKRAKKQVQLANTDKNHSSRWQLGTQALNAFLVMFVAATGMNWAQVCQLSWSDDFEITAELHQGFRTVKWRANGKKVFFELPIAFIPSFKRYIELRKYLLQNFSSDFLFITSNQISAQPGPILSSLHRTYALLKRIDPTIPIVMAKQWRSAKSDWLIRNTDIATTALVLQNSERTVLKNYTAGSEISHYEEVGGYLEKVVKSATARVIKIKQTALGACASEDTPKPITKYAPINPDCTSLEGCLFCLEHRIHADEKDVRKLLSCKYVINLSSPLSESEEAFQKMSGPIIARIDNLISEVISIAPEMVEIIRREVENEGKLDPYWESKLKILITLGL